MTERRRIWQAAIGLFFLCMLLYVWDLGLTPFYNYEEPKEALVVWEMVNRGNWVLPLRNGEETPLKPPLLHWLGALLALLTGRLNEFTIRFPSALAATAGVLLTFFFGYRLWGWRAGLLSALILATSPEWMRWAIIARSDMLLTFFSVAALMLFWWLWEEKTLGRWSLYLFYLLLGLAILAKGPVGILLPGLVVVCFLGVCRDLPFLRQLRLVEGAVIVSLVAASWYLLASWQGGWEFFQKQILDENVFRFLGSEQGGPSRNHAFYYYLPTLFAGMLPWSLFFPPLLYSLFRSRAELRDQRLLYPVAWCLVTLIFFSLASGKRSNYILVMYPAVALLLGSWWHWLVGGEEVDSVLTRRLGQACAYALCTVFSLAFLFLMAHGAGFDLDHIVTPFLHPRDQANLPLIAYGLQTHFGLVVVWLVFLGVAVSWYLWGLRKAQWIYVFSALTVAISASLYFTHALFRPLLAQERTYKPFMLGVRSSVKDAPLFFYELGKMRYDYGATFYADRRIAPYKEDLSHGLPDGVTSPLFFLMWEEKWQELNEALGQPSAGQSPVANEHNEPSLQSKHLATPGNGRPQLLALSKGRGPDKKHRLALVALFPTRENRTLGQGEEASH